MFPDISDLLAQLSLSYKLYILSTNSKPNIEYILNKYSIDRYFNDIYGDIGINGKTRNLKKLMRQQKLKPNECIYVGDELRDIQAAKKAKVSFIAVGWGYSNPETLKANHPYAVAQTPADIMHLVVHNK